MPYAITPRGVGRKPGARAVYGKDAALADGETFVVEEWSPDLVLSEDRASLRPATAAELTDMARHGFSRRMLEARGVQFTPPPGDTASDKLARIGLTTNELNAALAAAKEDPANR